MSLLRSKIEAVLRESVGRPSEHQRAILIGSKGAERPLVVMR